MMIKQWIEKMASILEWTEIIWPIALPYLIKSSSHILHENEFYKEFITHSSITVTVVNNSSHMSHWIVMKYCNQDDMIEIQWLEGEHKK